jgi:hypothetical protein
MKTPFQCLSLLACLLGAAQLALAQSFPTRPMRIIVPFSAGSASDILARLIGPKLTESWGQQVIVESRPSAGGTVAGGIVAASNPDGHTLQLYYAMEQIGWQAQSRSKESRKPRKLSEWPEVLEADPNAYLGEPLGRRHAAQCQSSRRVAVMTPSPAEPDRSARRGSAG